jgi:hypothetical protein
MAQSTNFALPLILPDIKPFQALKNKNDKIYLFSMEANFDP